MAVLQCTDTFSSAILRPTQELVRPAAVCGRGPADRGTGHFGNPDRQNRDACPRNPPPQTEQQYKAGTDSERKVFPMLRVRDLRIDPASLGAKKLLVDVAPSYEYKDGKRTDTVTGYRYVIALPAHSLEKIGVRIDGKQLMEKPEGFLEVEFSDLEVLAYEAQGHVQFAAKATGISAAKKN